MLIYMGTDRLCKEKKAALRQGTTQEQKTECPAEYCVEWSVQNTEEEKSQVV